VELHLHSLYVFMVWYLVKHREYFNIYYKKAVSHPGKGVPVPFLTEHHAMKAYWGIEA
jgi:hypothetical protein